MENRADQRGFGESTPKFTIRPYKKGDAEGIMALYNRIFNRESKLNQWKWLYERKDFPSLIMVAESNDGIVGHVSGVIKKMDYFGRSATAIHSFYAMVDSRYRRTGMFMDMMQVLEKAAMDRGVDFIYGFSYQEQVFPALQRLGRQEIGGLPVYIMPLHPIRLGSLKVPAARFMDILDDAAARFFGGNATPLPSMPAVSFGKAYGDLWAKTAPANSVAVNRDTDYLVWRYAARPGGGYRVMIAEGRTGLEGYAIIRTETKWELTVVFVMELVAEADSDAFDRLINGITAHAAAMGADAVSMVAGPACPWQDNLLSKGFLKVPEILLPRRIKLTMKPLLPAIQMGELINPGNWILSWGDTFYV